MGREETASAPRRGNMVRNTLHLGLGQVVTTVLSIVVSAVVARALTTSEFGLLYLVFSIATFAYVVVDWGHGQYLIREAVRHPARAGELFGSTLALRSVMAVVACVVAVAATWLLGYDNWTLLLTGAMILALLPQYLGLSFGWVFRAYERMDRDALLNVAMKVAALVCTIAFLALGGRLMGIVLANAVAGLLTLAVGLAMYRSLALPAVSATLPAARELLQGGAPIFAILLATAIEPVFNANILYNMASSTVVGWYGAASTIAGTLVAPASVLAAAVYPRLSAAAGDAAEFRTTVEITLRPLMLIAVLGAVGTYLFAEVPVAIVYSLDKFAPAADTLRAFAPVLLLMYVNMLLGMAILAVGRAGRLAITKVGTLVVTTGFVLVLVPWCQSRFSNGGLGVMYAMLVGEVLMLIASFFLMRSAVTSRTIADLIRGFAVGLVTVVLFKLLPPFTPFLAIPACLVTFGGLAVLLGALRRSDIDVLLSALRRRSA